MTVRNIARFRVAALAVVLVIAGCGKKPPEPPPPPPPPPAGPPPAEMKAELVSLTLVASADVNPNASGRPSPVVVRIYQLRRDTRFSAADLLDLYDEEQKTLGDDLIEKAVEVTLRPNESMPVAKFFVSPYTQFIGVIAAYRDYRNAQQWKVLVPRAVPVPKTMTVSVGKSRLEFAAR